MLHGRRFRLKPVHHIGKLHKKAQQTLRKIIAFRGAHAVADMGDLAAHSIHHPPAGTPQSRINPDHPHSPAPFILVKPA